MFGQVMLPNQSEIRNLDLLGDVIKKGEEPEEEKPKMLYQSAFSTLGMSGQVMLPDQSEIRNLD